MSVFGGPSYTYLKEFLPRLDCHISYKLNLFTYNDYNGLSFTKPLLSTPVHYRLLDINSSFLCNLDQQVSYLIKLKPDTV